jgi:thymidylate kinase
MARAIARSEDRTWIEHTAGFALVPHAVYYLRAEVKDLITRVVVGKGAFDYWESGLDLGFGPGMFESFVRYQGRLIRVFDQMAKPYAFQVIDATQSPDQVFLALKASIAEALALPPAVVKRPRAPRTRRSVAAG